MRRKYSRQLAAATLAFTLIAAGCGDDDTEDSASDTTAPSDESSDTTTDDTSDEGGEDGDAVAVTLTDDGVEGLPEEITGGAVTFEITNEASAPAGLELVKGGDGASSGDITDALGTAQSGGEIGEVVANFVGGPPIEPGATTTITATMSSGSWFGLALVESEDDSGGYADAAEFTVSEGGDAELPDAESSVVASDYSFDIDITAGAEQLSFTNDGPSQFHHAIFFPMAEGIDEEAARPAVEAFLQSEDDEGPPPAEFDFESDPGSDTNVAGPNHGVVQPQGDFEPGRTYAVVCFLQDRAGGQPHAIAYDMWDVFTVAE